MLLSIELKPVFCDFHYCAGRSYTQNKAREAINKLKKPYMYDFELSKRCFGAIALERLTFREIAEGYNHITVIDFENHTDSVG